VIKGIKIHNQWRITSEELERFLRDSNPWNGATIFSAGGKDLASYHADHPTFPAIEKSPFSATPCHVLIFLTFTECVVAAIVLPPYFEENKKISRVSPCQDYASDRLSGWPGAVFCPIHLGGVYSKPTYQPRPALLTHPHTYNIAFFLLYWK
jgi:hypothetical protein